MRTALLCAVAVLLGCNSTPAPEKALLGDWFSVRSDTSAQLLSFNEEGAYVVGFLVSRSATTGDLELERGWYDVDGRDIVLSPTDGTCLISAAGYRLGWRRNGNALVITYSNGLVSFERSASGSSGSVSLDLGCFDRDTGAFVRGELMPAQ